MLLKNIYIYICEPNQKMEAIVQADYRINNNYEQTRNYVQKPKKKKTSDCAVAAEELRRESERGRGGESRGKENSNLTEVEFMNRLGL